MIDKHGKCGKCHYWNPDELASGFCQRNAPTWGVYQGSWPTTKYDDWCGEFHLNTDFANDKTPKN